MFWTAKQESLLGSHVAVDADDLRYTLKDSQGLPGGFQVMGPSPCPWAWHQEVSEEVAEKKKADHVFRK
eukprot:12051780-Prorocentrum_lima.AAC.1